ncbi:MAG: hypothetical protein CBD16_06345 [Betaproteobacteria bacterium TMED156]|nr:MAG: hypothetical protein CBD16_06345 [Betaproteobacteria bacterium TMED156]
MVSNSALILLAHGSKNLNWKKPFSKIRKKIESQRFFDKVELAFFELDTPLLEDVVIDVKQKNFLNIKIQPLILANGFHVEKDLPKRIVRLKEKYKNLNISVGVALINHEEICNAIVTSILNTNSRKYD